MERGEVDIWNYVFGFVKTAVVKCAIELGIAEVIDQNHGSPMPLSELTTALRCDPSRLHRIMRFLVHYKIFKEEPISQQHSVAFSLTPLSRLLIRHEEKTMVPFILLESSPFMLAAWHNLSAYVLGGSDISPFEATHEKDLWSYTEANPEHSKLFNESMACSARLTVPAIIKGCPEVFDGIESLVDVGGGNGTALSLLVKAFPWIRGINFDLPHNVVVSSVPKFDGIENVGGDMFTSIPNADAAFFMWILHDWNDEECIKILKKCREAISEDKGKVIIVDAVLDQEDKDDELGSVRLMLDIAMMAHTNNGKERSLKEWNYILQESGFARFNVKSINTISSVIEAYP